MQTALKENPFSGHVYIPAERCGELIKLLGFAHDSQLCPLGSKNQAKPLMGTTLVPTRTHPRIKKCARSCQRCGTLTEQE